MTGVQTCVFRSNDIVIGGAGVDEIDGGAGFDIADYSTDGPVTVNLNITGPQNTGGSFVDTLIGIEGVWGSSWDDIVLGNGAANRLEGAAGRDTLDGGAGDDVLNGGADGDSLYGSGGNY